MTKAGTPIRPLSTAEEHRTAVARIEDLIGAAGGTPEEDELNVLSTLVEAYESNHHAIDAPDIFAAIQFRIEQQH